MLSGEIRFFLHVLETIQGSAYDPILIEDDDENNVQDNVEDNAESPQSPNNDDDESDDEEWIYEWQPLELREFRLLRSYARVPGNEYYLFYVFVELRKLTIEEF